jgi:hypothetical protein
MTSAADEPDIFDGCEMDEVAAVVFQQAGPEGLRGLMDKLIDFKIIDKDSLWDIAESLEHGGLPDGACIVRDAAENAPSKKVVEIAHILSGEYPCSIRPRLLQGVRRGRYALEDLEAAGTGKEIIDYVTQQMKAAQACTHAISRTHARPT